MSSVEPLRILVVEDDRSCRDALVELLRDHGYEVTSASGGAQALARLDDDRPDLVISDVCMPGTDGFEMTRALRARASASETRLILVSALGDTERRVHGLDLGADDFLAKPLDPDELLARIRAQLRRARRHSDVLRMTVIDGLTGVLNRRGVFEELERAITRTRSEGQSLSLLVVDIDDFKQINDTLGHAAGDGVLRSVTERLKHEVRAADQVGRVGGDEFVVILSDIGTRDAVAIADRIRTVDGPTGAQRVGVSVGAATLRSGEGPDELIARADHAMYVRKRQTKAPRRSAHRRSSEPPVLGDTTYGVGARRPGG